MIRERVRADIAQAYPAMQPARVLSVETYTWPFMWCDRCLPPWQISYIPIDWPPWSALDRRTGNRFRCPGCRGAVWWHVHGPTWRPFATA
jgi:hypothetical protein